MPVRSGEGGRGIRNRVARGGPLVTGRAPEGPERSVPDLSGMVVVAVATVGAVPEIQPHQHEKQPGHVDEGHAHPGGEHDECDNDEERQQPAAA